MSNSDHDIIFTISSFWIDVLRDIKEPHYVVQSSTMSHKSVATCYWFQKLYFICIYVNVNGKTTHNCRKYKIDDLDLICYVYHNICRVYKVSGFKTL